MAKKEITKFEVLPFEFERIGAPGLTAGSFEKENDISEGLIQLKKDGKIGFSDIKGEIVIPIIYDEAKNFKDGLATVRLSDKWGVINRKNDIIIPFEFDEISAVMDGRIRAKQEGKYGYFDKEGKIVIPLDFSAAEDFEQGLAIVSKTEGNTDYGMIDINGNVIMPFKYDEICFLSENIIRYKSNDQYGLFNLKGEVLLPCDFDGLRLVSDNIIRFKADNKYGLLDLKGEVILANEYDDIQNFENGLAQIKKGDLVGVIDSDMNCVVPVDFKYIYFHRNFIEVVKNNKKGIYRNGEELLPCEYNDIFGIDIEEYPVIIKETPQGEKKGLIDSKGNVIVSCQYDEIGIRNGIFTIVGINNKYGVVKNNEIVIAPEYDKITLSRKFNVLALLKDGNVEIRNEELQVVSTGYDKLLFTSPDTDYLIVSKDGKSGLIGQNGELVLPCEYTIKFLFLNWACVVKDGKKGIWDDGRFIIECIYDDIEYDTYSGNYPRKPQIVGASKDGKWGLLKNNEVVHPFNLSKVFSINNDLAIIETSSDDKKCHLIDEKGNILFSTKKEKYSDIEIFYDKDDKGQPTGLLRIYYSKKEGRYSYEMKELIVPVKYIGINSISNRIFDVLEKNKDQILHGLFVIPT